MTDQEKTEIMHRAISVYGERAQIAKAMEEIAELAAELARYLNGINSSEPVLEELADVKIMSSQLGMIFGDTSEIEEYKLRRLDERMGGQHGN